MIKCGRGLEPTQSQGPHANSAQIAMKSHPPEVPSKVQPLGQVMQPISTSVGLPRLISRLNLLSAAGALELRLGQAQQIRFHSRFPRPRYLWYLSWYLSGAIGLLSEGVTTVGLASLAENRWWNCTSLDLSQMSGN